MCAKAALGDEGNVYSLFSLSHSDPDAAFQPTAKARVHYVYIIQWLVLAASLLGLGRLLYMLYITGMKRKNVRSNDLISRNRC